MLISRRSALLSTAAASLAAPLAMVAYRSGADDAAIEAAAAAYWKARELRNTIPDYPTDAELDAVMDARVEAYDAVMTIRAGSMRGLRIKGKIYRVETFPTSTTTWATWTLTRCSQISSAWPGGRHDCRVAPGC